jgi:hypothetical protein
MAVRGRWSKVSGQYAKPQEAPIPKYSSSHFDALAGNIAVDAAKQSSQDASWPDFVELIEALGDEIPHRILPAHGLEDLLNEDLADFLGIVVREGIDVGDDANSRSFHCDIGEGGSASLVGGAHYFGMERAGDGQGDGLHGAARLSDFGGTFAGPEASGDHDVSGAEQVGDYESLTLSNLLAEGFDLDPFEAEDADHSAGSGVGGFLHGCAAALDDGEAILEFHDAGEDHGSVFAEAEAGGSLAGEDDVGGFSPEGLKRGEASDEDGWLAADGRIEFVGGPLKAELCKVVAEDFCSAIIQAPDGWERLGKPLSHSDRLGALSGKEESDSAQDSVSTTLRPM